LQSGLEFIKYHSSLPGIQMKQHICPYDWGLLRGTHVANVRLLFKNILHPQAESNRNHWKGVITSGKLCIYGTERTLRS
jgi:hypothetical protein